MSKDRAETRGTDGATAGVVARPPLLFLGALLGGLVLERLAPLGFVVPTHDLARWIVAGALAVSGSAVAVAGMRNFARAGTPVPTNKPVRALVTTGIHGRTRNPIYLGMFLVYSGVGVGARSPWVLMLVLPLAIVVRYGVVAREEAYLERRFGEAYRDYRRGVRRWL